MLPTLSNESIEIPGLRVIAVVGRGFRIDVPIEDAEKTEIEGLLKGGEPLWVNYVRGESK